MHALGEYGLMHVKLYEDIARHGHIATTYAYPVKVNERYVMDPSPTPKFDNPKMDDCAALQLFGAGREKRIYAILHIPRWYRLISRITRLRRIALKRHVRCAVRTALISTKWWSTTKAGGCLSAPIPTIAKRAGRTDIKAPASSRIIGWPDAGH
jgi:hypothetical protein